MKRRLTAASWVCAGCALAPGGDPTVPAAGTALTRSADFVVAESAAAPVITAAGAGVTVQWAGAQGISVPAESGGLGPVVATRRGEAGGVTLVHRGGVEERWTVTAAGAEQAWRYAARPAGDRVAVSVTLAGARLDREADDGLWLRGATGGLLRYGHATWVDAAGRRTAVRSRWAGGRIELEVPAEVVAASAYPAVLDPTLTPEFAVEPTMLENIGTFIDAASVRTATGSLLFTLRGYPGASSGFVMVERLDAAGALVPGSFRGVPATGAVGERIWVAASGGGAWVVWAESGRIVGARVDATGNSLDRTAVTLQTGRSVIGFACNASRCMVLGIDTNGRASFTRFAPTGELLDPTPVALTTLTSGGMNNFRQSLTALDDRFVVAWSERPAGSTSEVRLARIGLDGVVQDPGGRAVSTAGVVQVTPSVASNGSALFLTYDASASGSRPQGLYAVALDRNLAALSPASVVLPGETTAAPRTLWDGTRWLLATPREVVRYAADGTRLDATARPLLPTPAGSASEVSAAVLGQDLGGFFVRRNYGSSNTAQRYASDGTASGPVVVLPVRAVDQFAAAVDCDGTEFLASWAHPFPRWRLARVSAAGVVRDSPPVPVSTPQGLNGINALLLEGATARVFGTVAGAGFGRVAVDLDARTTGAVEATAPVAGEGIVVRGTAQRLLFFRGSTGGIPTSSSVVRYNAAGARLDPAAIVLPQAYALTADFDGAGYLIVYSTGASGVFSRRLDAAGDFVETSPRSLGALGAVAGGPWLSFGGGTHLLAWVDAARQVRATRLGLDGTPAAGTPLLLDPAGANGTGVALTFNGRNFVAVWTSADGRARATRVSPAGAALDAPPLVLPDVGAFSAASDTHGSTLVVDHRFDRDVGAFVVRGRFLRDDGAAVPDAGAPDAGDATAAMDVPVGIDVPVGGDATAVDASTAADGALDAPTDAGPAPIDAGAPTDAGPAPTDAGPAPADAGPADASAPATDSPTAADAGAAADAGSAPPPDDGGVCSVQSGVGAHQPLGLRGSSALLLGAGALLRRRRHRR